MEGIIAAVAAIIITVICWWVYYNKLDKFLYTIDSKCYLSQNASSCYKLIHGEIHCTPQEKEVWQEYK